MSHSRGLSQIFAHSVCDCLLLYVPWRYQPACISRHRRFQMKLVSIKQSQIRRADRHTAAPSPHSPGTEPVFLKL